MGKVQILQLRGRDVEVEVGAAGEGDGGEGWKRRPDLQLFCEPLLRPLEAGTLA